MVYHSKHGAKPVYCVYQVFPDGSKERLDVTPNKYEALAFGFRQYRQHPENVYVVRQRRWPTRDSEFDATIATYGEHISYLSE